MKVDFQQRLSRVLLMVPIILKEKGITVDDLAEKLHVAADEVRKDLDLLWLCGLPGYDPGDLINVRYEGELVFLDMADYFKRPLKLTRDEAMSLVIAGEALLKAGVFESDSPCASALEKVKQLVLDDADDVVHRVEVELENYPAGFWSLIQESIETGKCLKMDYYSFSRGEMTSREVDPVSLLTWRGYWYMVAWCHNAEEKRFFRLDRIMKPCLSTEYRIVDGHREDGDLNVIGEYKPGRKSYRVILRFGEREGRRVAEEWPAARLSENADGTVTIELKTGHLEWLSNYLLRFSDRFTVESPVELAALTRDNASQILDMYS